MSGVPGGRMKKLIEKEVQVCDCCGKETHCEQCLGGCGLEHCKWCRRECGVGYTHAVHFSISDDGYYCALCNTKLSEQGSDDLHNAYLAITDLRREAKRWSADFSARSDKTEALLKQLVGI